MLSSILNRSRQSHSNKPFLVSGATRWSYADLHGIARQLAAALDAQGIQRLGCYLSDSPRSIALIIAAAASGRSLLLINPDEPPQQALDYALRWDRQALVVDRPLDVRPSCPLLDIATLWPALAAKPTAATGPVAAADFTAVDGELLILTSGTTGAPKCVRYRWSDLLGQIGEHAPGADERWLLAYRLNHFAGIQMLAHILANGGTLVMAPTHRVADALQAITAHAVTHVSSTPTFWRFALALLADSAKPVALRHITLGSEPVSADLLQRLAAAFPGARIVQIYALTEAGSCISVSDGRPGLPASILDRPADAPVRFRIVDGQLEVRSRHGMAGYVDPREADQGAAPPVDGDGWFSTGDLVELSGDRIHFLGRTSETINVGGVKVHPLAVEDVILRVDGVKLARVYGQDNPIVGQIVAADLVVADGADRAQVEDDVRAACRLLSRQAAPRNINFVDELELNNLKLSRRSKPTP